MSVTTVSFQHTTLPSETYLTELGSDGPPYTVHGVALGAGDITQGASGIKKKWPANELKEAADTLEGTNLVVDHKNNADGVVGKVVKAGYKEDTGIVYEAELYEEKLAEKIENGLLEVSIRGYHADVSELDEDDETGALIVEDITFDNLSIVPQGASPSNTLKMGEHDELTAAELEAAIVGMKADELLDEPEPGMWVTDGDMQGITIGMPEDGEIEVDVYEESDGQWRSTEETIMVMIDDLSEWDVEESDIGPVEDDSDEEENSRCLDIVASLMDMSIPMPEDAQLLYPSEEKAQEAAEMMGLDGIHGHYFEGETWYMPGADHATFEDAMDAQSTEENAALIEEGMKFFSTVNNSEVFVKDVSGKMVTVQVVDGESMWKEEVDNIIQKLADGDWEHAGEMESSEMIDTPDLREGMMVEWQVMPQMKGKIVHNPEDEPFVMVEVMEDGEPSGYTLTAGYSDVRPIDTEEMAQDAKYGRGDWVNWDTRNSTELGKVTGAYMEGDDLPDFRGSRGLSPEGDEILYALRMYKERDGSWHPIKGKPIGHYEDSLRSAEKPSDVSDSPVELGRSNAQNYTNFSVDDWVQWYTETGERHGRVTSVNQENEQVTAQVWDQTSDGEWYETDEDVTKAFDDKIEPWGNFPREQDDFADTIEGEDPRRAVKPSEEENTDSDELISEQVKEALKEKAEEHNEEHGDKEGKEVTYRMLKNVFERGMGAYQDSHREGMSPQQWSYARVNAFLYLVRNGQPENDQYVQDNDLLPEDHPKYDEDAPDDNDSEENALTTTDVIVSDVFGQHDPMGSDEDETPQTIVERVVTAELESDEKELDGVYSEWSDAVNMTASELRRWSKNPCSREASLEPVSVMERNLRLLERNKSEWTENDISDAKRTISFIARMRGADSADLDGGPYGCPSKRDISLLNWAYNPFDSMPEHPDSDELDSVEEVTLAADEGETHSGEASDVVSLADYEMHEVSYEGTHDNEWDRPNLEDFVMAMGIEDDVSEYDDLTQQAQEDVASAFILSASGFPAEDYGDLKLPVVEPNGELSLNALAAVKGGRGASAVEDLSDEMEEDIIDYVNQLASDEFDRNWSEEENMPKHYGEKDDEEYMDVPDDHMFESKSDAEEKAEEMGISGAHKMGDMWVPGASHEEYMMAVEEMASTATGKSVDTDVHVALQTSNNKLTLTDMNDTLEEQLSELDNPVAVEAEELEDLESKADRFDEMSENLEALRERTEVLDEVDQSSIEELRDTEEPVIVERESYDELQSEAQQVKTVYATSLAEEMGAFDAEELSDRFSIEELRSKFEEAIGDVEEELGSNGSEEAAPRGQDPPEEELEEANRDNSDELSDEVAEKQAEIREKILST